MLAGLPQLRRAAWYRGKQLAEFDLDAALALQPPLILMDELAHSNAPGSRPQALAGRGGAAGAGIDVLTTVNVQHLESLNDVVGGITGIRVAKRCPTRCSTGRRSGAGRPAGRRTAGAPAGRQGVSGAQAERASKNFFRKGNLIALRELALRRTADRIEGDVRAYRVEQSIADIWKTGAALLACVGPRADGEHTVRSTRAWPASSAPAGTRCTSRRRRCSGCRRAARADPETSSWPRSWAPPPPCWRGRTSPPPRWNMRAATTCPSWCWAAPTAAHGNLARAASSGWRSTRPTST
jgi:hypothetical protein